MINKTIKITIAQITMWVAACLADAIQCHCLDNRFMDSVCLFILPICLMIGYTLMWWSNNSYNKGQRLIKRMFWQGICLSIWWLETYLFLILICKLIEMDKWIVHNPGFIPWGLYFYWALLAAIIPVVVTVVRAIIIWVKQ